MITKIIEATNDNKNWGKFLVMRPDVEWERGAKIEGSESRRPLLAQRGWTPEHIWVLDLETGEGACFRPKGLARADLNKHRVWVCPLFEPFLTWLYTQELSDLQALPDVVNLPDAPFDYAGYRREGPKASDLELVERVATLEKALDDLMQRTEAHLQRIDMRHLRARRSTADERSMDEEYRAMYSDAYQAAEAALGKKS